MNKLFEDLKASINDMIKHLFGEHVQDLTLNVVSTGPMPEVNAQDEIIR